MLLNLEKKLQSLNGVKHMRRDILTNQYRIYLQTLYKEGGTGISETPPIPGKRVIVSLTTYGKRLYEVYLTIESIMQQTMRPDKIVLWLSDEYSESDIPLHLRQQQTRGLEINYCKDLKSYKKLIPSLQCFPDDVIITVDDDVYYFDDMIEKLVNGYKKDPSYIYCNRMFRIALDRNGHVRPYKKWRGSFNENDQASPLNFATGVGGVLYPPHCFPAEVFNESVFMDICQHADDIWFKAMALSNGVQYRKVVTHTDRGEEYYNNTSIQVSGLYQMNVHNHGNDKQFRAVFDKYNLYPLLLETSRR